MAQTKSRSSRSSGTSSRSKSGSTKGRTTSARSTKSSSRSRKPTQRRSTSTSSRSNQSKSTAATIAEKAKGPALAGGAALVGLAGGLALNRNNKKRGVIGRIPTPSVKAPNVKLPKVSMPQVKPDSALRSIGKAAGEVAQRSHRVGDVASEVQKASDAIGKRT